MDNPTTLTAPTSSLSDVPEKAGEAPLMGPGYYDMFGLPSPYANPAEAKAEAESEAAYNALMARLRAARDAPEPKRSKPVADKEKARGDEKAQEGGAPQTEGTGAAKEGEPSTGAGGGGSNEDDDFEKDIKESERLHEAMETAASNGDLDRLVRMLGVYPFWDYPCEDFPNCMYLIRVGLETAARQNPEKLGDFLAARIMAFEGWLLIRAQYVVLREAMIHDKRMHQPQGDLPANIESEWIPRVARIADGIARTASTFASVRHTMELGRGRKRRKKVRTAGAEDREPN